MRFALLLALAPLLAGGCRTAAYYCQAVCGQWQLSRGQKPIRELVNDPAQSEKLRTQLKLVLEMREFAGEELGLPPGDAYLKYKKLDREYPVWVVFAAPELSTRLKTWWYPFIGHAEVRSYFRKKAAERCAERLRQKGYDVHVAGAPAYSTLGWFADPVLSSFVYLPENKLADMIFHELAHRRYYLPGDSAFNESYATAVGESGVRRWLSRKEDAASLRDFENRLNRRDGIAQANEEVRAKLKSLYDDEALDVPAKRVRKQTLLKAHRAKLEEFGGRFSEPMNNASLAAMGMYRIHVPAFRQLLKEVKNDLPEFYRRVRSLGLLPLVQRRQVLDNLCNAYDHDLRAK